MEIIIKLNYVLRRHTTSQDGCMKLIIKEGTTVKDLLDCINTLPGEVGLIILNSKIVGEETVLSDHDIVEFYPILGGG